LQSIYLSSLILTPPTHTQNTNTKAIRNPKSNPRNEVLPHNPQPSQTKPNSVKEGEKRQNTSLTTHPTQTKPNQTPPTHLPIKPEKRQ
jgi:hypothetical protein